MSFNVLQLDAHFFFPLKITAAFWRASPLPVSARGVIAALSVMKVRNDLCVLSRLLIPHLKGPILPDLSEMILLQCLQEKNILEFHHYRFTFSKNIYIRVGDIITSSLKKAFQPMAPSTTLWVIGSSDEKLSN